jgi:pimeloyl-ACP methyl ester carboxylesterase
MNTAKTAPQVLRNVTNENRLRATMKTMIPTPPRRLQIPFTIRGRATQHMIVHDWGDVASEHIVLCVHGLSRNGRDFDVIAEALAGNARVLCPDVPGRGESDWLASATDYAIPTYVEVMRQMIAHLRITRYDWIGTSMGGLIGMVIAATPGNHMRRFVCNDVGPEIERPALERIGACMGGRMPEFENYEQLFRAAQLAIASFGPLTMEQKHHIVRTSCKQIENGKWAFNTDPKIGEAFVTALKQPAADLWPLWRAIKKPTLILRGEHSDLLSTETLARMTVGRAHTQALEIADTGHAPMMMDAATITSVAQFLNA